MVIGLLVVTAIPTTIGVCQALSAQKKANNAAKEKNKFNLTATVCIDGRTVDEVFVVLSEGRLWLDHPKAPMSGCHKFAGYYFTYPSEDQHLGLVSTIADDPPMLNWIYVDRATHGIRHAGRKDTLGEIIGPWHWSDDEKRLTLEVDDRSFVAVEVENKKWALFYDRDRKIRGSSTSLRGRVRTPVVLGNPVPEEANRDDGGEGEGKAERSESSEQQPPDDTNKPPPRPQRLRWCEVRLNRQLAFGMESRYVKDNA